MATPLVSCVSAPGGPGSPHFTGVRSDEEYEYEYSSGAEESAHEDDADGGENDDAILIANTFYEADGTWAFVDAGRWSYGRWVGFAWSRLCEGSRWFGCGLVAVVPSALAYWLWLQTQRFGLHSRLLKDLKRWCSWRAIGARR